MSYTVKIPCILSVTLGVPRAISLAQGSRSLGSSELSGSVHAFGGRNLGPRVTPGLGVSPDRNYHIWKDI